MQAITIGVGPYLKLAEYSAARMEEMTGLEVMVLTDYHMKGLNITHPAWLKLWAYDFAGHTDIMIFDADVWCMKEWSPESALADSSLAVVRDELSTAVIAECDLYGIGRGNYFNAGLLIADSDQRIFQEARKYAPKYGKWLEQTALNRESWIQQVCPNYLPRAYNRLLWPGADSYDSEYLNRLNVVNLHFASLGDPEIILTTIKAI